MVLKPAKTLPVLIWTPIRFIELLFPIVSIFIFF
jgi:hypothetical protein